MHFGQFMADIRIAAKMRQEDLAARAQVHVSTVAKQERSESHIWGRSTSVRVLRALESIGAISPREKATFMEAAGLQTLAQMTKRGMHQASAEGERTRYLVASIHNPEERICVWWLLELIDEVGAPAIAASLTASAAVAGIELTRPPDTEMPVTFSVIGPPRQAPHWVEQIVVDYEDRRDDTTEENPPKEAAQ
jgi:transcriptional regulator with XRE-family HTH domain